VDLHKNRTMKQMFTTTARLLLLVSMLLSGCQTAVQPPATQVEAAAAAVPTITAVISTTEPVFTVVPEPLEEPTQEPTLEPTHEPISVLPPRSAGEPVGCLPPEAQEEFTTSLEMLAYADRLLKLPQPLAKRILTASWNGQADRYFHSELDVYTLTVSSLKNDYGLQKVLNALHVAGFAAWLRESPDQGLHILAVALLDPVWQDSDWALYIRSYWQDRHSIPEGDPYVIANLKLPPCRWMVERGFAPPVDADWWASNPVDWPDYTLTASSYLASTTEDANRVAEKIDWLGPGLKEEANTMCGPLAWAQMNDAGAFPPGAGGWLNNPKNFWLSLPPENGRPWSLFPPELYQVYQITQPLSTFDFGRWPLYPGDFLYTYSLRIGFDHMVLVNEVDEDGNIWVITNRVWVRPEKKLTIERVILANFHDPELGIARNEWKLDRKNGITGHAGFDVFRWAWMEKDVNSEPVAYTVQLGDTVGLIAARWRTPADLIARYNGIEIDEDLLLGQELTIPPNEGKLWK
jgi:hypothetical protein